VHAAVLRWLLRQQADRIHKKMLLPNVLLSGSFLKVMILPQTC